MGQSNPYKSKKGDISELKTVQKARLGSIELGMPIGDDGIKEHISSLAHV